MTTQYLLDANVVAYAASKDPGAAAKTAIARRLLLTDSAGTSAQVLQEFFVVVTRGITVMNPFLPGAELPA